MAIRHGYHTNALDDLYTLMNDSGVSMRVRLNAAVSASRVEPLAQPEQPQPPAVLFLRNVTTFKHEGKQYRAEWRREAATALAHFERRAVVQALKFSITDDQERQAEWRRILNGLIRQNLHRLGRWPQDKTVLLAPDEPFDAPPYEPELALAAILIPERKHARQRKVAIDQPDAPIIASEQQRRDILAAIDAVINPRLEGL